MTETFAHHMLKAQTIHNETRTQRDALVALLASMLEQMSNPANAEHTLGAFMHGAQVAAARELIAIAKTENKLYLPKEASEIPWRTQ